MTKQITITEKDHSRIKILLAGIRSHSEQDSVNQRKLHDSLSSANIVQSQEIPGNIVTMNSRVSVRDPQTGSESVYTLVYPEMANYHKGFISILAPLGAALLGSRAGEVICWEVPKGEKKLELIKVLYQPEINGDLHV